MKNSILCLLLVFGLTSSYAFDEDNINVAFMGAGEDRSCGFHLYTQNAEKVYHQLCVNANKSISDYGIHKFRKLSIPGIQEKVTLQVHLGMHTVEEYSCETNTNNLCGYSKTFHTFTTKKYKESQLEKATANSRLGIIIYVKQGIGRNFLPATETMIKSVKEYLRSLTV